MSDMERVKEKIRALLRLGADESGATEAEAENAIRFARRLMLQHNVREDQLEELDPHEAAAAAEREEYGQATATTEGSVTTNWESVLAAAVSRLVGSVGNYLANGTVPRRKADGTLEFNPVTGKPMIHRAFVFYGPAEDARDATVLYREWSAAIVALARMKYGGALKGPGRSYCDGFAQALWRKALAALREEQALIEAFKARAALPAGETHASALVVVNGNASMVARRERADTWLRNTQGIRLSNRSRSGQGSHDSGAFAAGSEDGRRSDFSRTRRKKLGGGQ